MTKQGPFCSCSFCSILLHIIRSFFVHDELKVESENVILAILGNSNVRCFSEVLLKYHANTLPLIIQFKQYLRSKMVLVGMVLNVQCLNYSPPDGHAVKVCFINFNWLCKKMYFFFKEHFMLVILK